MDFDRCYAAALRLLNYRWRTEKELDERLRKKGFDAEVIQPVLARLKEENWVNDRRFASSFVQSQRQKHHGRRRIEQELRSRGVEKEAASEVLQDTTAERDALAELCRRRIRVMTRLRGNTFATSGDGRRKLTAYLLRQGYDYSDVLAVVEEELGKI